MSTAGFVTVYSDASFCPDTQAAGWAIWCRSEHGRVTRAGECPAYVTSSVQAELVAAYAGIWLARHVWPATKTVLVKTDCQAILPHASGEQSRSRDRVVRMLRQKVAAVGVAVVAQWTPGHSTGQDVAAFINRWCDNEARRWMRRARGQMRGAGPAMTRPVLTVDDVKRMRSRA